MIRLDSLSDRFSKHILTCKSAKFVLNRDAAFESWFRVELVPVLEELGYSADQIETNYRYPETGGKADLCVRIDGCIVFELKSFVSGQDANKKQEYPKQIKRLEKIIESKSCNQVIAFTTFIGYSQQQMQNYLRSFFDSTKWETFGPLKISEEDRLYVSISTIALKN